MEEKDKVPLIPIEINKLLFYPICSKEEIERIFNVKSAQDHLLKLRAETIVDHTRLFRVYRNKALLKAKNWTLEGSFQDKHYFNVLQKLTLDKRTMCQKITYGDMFSNDPNGMIFSTQYGPITTISESLKFFLKFSHLALQNFSIKVPVHVRMNSLRIAIRVMLKTEALDFFMDPRGIIPPKVASSILEPIPFQMQFIAGHEFAHYILGHLSELNVVEQPVFCAISTKDKEYKLQKVYNTSQKEELDADLHSIILPRYSDRQRLKLLESALLWFGCLELYEVVSSIMYPKSLQSQVCQTHPTARERYDNLLTKVPTPKGFDLSVWTEFPKQIEYLSKYLQEDVLLNWDAYEQYGSCYLDNPNTQWRGRELVDRVDYY